MASRQQHCFVARYRGHRRQHIHRLGAAAAWHHIETERRDLSVEQGINQIKSAQWIELADQHLTGRKLGQRIGDRRLNGQQHLRLLQNCLTINNLCALLSVVGVLKKARSPAPFSTKIV